MACKRREGPSKSQCQPSDALDKGQMHFFKIILHSMIQEKKLMIPPKFARKYGDELSAVATLCVANGRVWRVGLTKAENSIYFHVGWHEFVEYYSIRQGYFLVFTYEGISNFRVLIFDMTACEINYPFNGPSSEQEPNNDKQIPVLNEDEMEDDDSIEILGFTSPPVKRAFNRSSRKPAMYKRFNPSSKHVFRQSTASMDSSKNGNGYETKSKKCKMEDQVEIIDLDNVNESSQGKISENEMSSSYGSLLDKTKDNSQHPIKNEEEEEEDDDDDDDGDDEKQEDQEDEDDDNENDDFDDYEEGEEEESQEETEEEKNTINKSRSQKKIGRNNHDDVEVIVSRKFPRYASQDRERAIRVAKLFKPKNPSFMVILRPYSFSGSNLCVPFEFGRKYLSRDSEYLILQNSDRRAWPVLIKWRDMGGLNLRKGWSEFSRANNLEEGDVCIFELIKTNDVVLKVSIFHVSTE